MATDYDAPRKNDDDSESIEALKDRVPDAAAASITCISCFLVKHRSQIDHEEKLGAICLECAA